MINKRFVLHLGAHKTGTTALQEYCETNSKELAKAGVVYAGFTTNPWSTYRTIRDLSENARGEGSFADGVARVKLVVENARRVLARPDVMIFLVPWEIYLGEPFEDGHRIIYPHARKALEAIAEAFRELPVKIVYTIRDQWSFLNSWYLMIHKLGRLPDPEAYRQWALQSDLSWRPIVYAMHELFGPSNVQILHYDPATPASGDLLRNLFDAYGYTGPLDLSAFKRRNVSWPAEAIEIARHVMPLLPDGRERYLFRLKLDQVFEYLEGRPLRVLDEETRHLLDAQYGAENNGLVNRAGLGGGCFD